MYQQENDDIEQPAAQDTYERLNTFVRKLRRKRNHSLPDACCCCLETRVGGRLACLIWAGLSLYLACLAFMNKSPFYSYFNRIALTIFGVLNLFFFFVTTAGVFVITWKAAPIVLDRLSQIIWIFVIAILADMVANYIVFLARPSDFNTWCINLSQTVVQQAFNQSNQNNTIIIPLEPFNDYYNCSRLYQDQVTWTLLCIVAMSLVYIHWAMVITSWERWYIIQPPRMAPSNGGKHTATADIPYQFPNADHLENKQFGDFQEPPPVPTSPAPMSSLGQSQPFQQTFPPADQLQEHQQQQQQQQQQQREEYYDDGRYINSSGNHYYAQPPANQYIGQEQADPDDPKYEGQYHDQQQQQPLQYGTYSVSHQPYYDPQQSQFYHRNGQFNEDGYFRY